MSLDRFACACAAYVCFDPILVPTAFSGVFSSVLWLWRLETSGLAVGSSKIQPLGSGC